MSAPRDRIYGILRLHIPDHDQRCQECFKEFPCPTILIAKGRWIFDRTTGSFKIKEQHADL